MSINSGHYLIAEDKNKSVQLRALVGAYELMIGISGSVNPQVDVARWINVYSGRVTLRSPHGQRELGTAFPTAPVVIRQSQYSSHFSIDLRLVLQPTQLSALEEFRNAGDLDFDIGITGVSGGNEQASVTPDYQTLTIHIPQSTWISSLKSANALNVLLLEVPMPVVGASPKRKAAFAYLTQAQTLFTQGLYDQCVAECRKVVEEVEKGVEIFSWKAQREDMSKQDRLRSILAAIRLSSNLSAHSESRGGESFSRADAKFLMSVLAAYVVHEADA